MRTKKFLKLSASTTGQKAETGSLEVLLQKSAGLTIDHGFPNYPSLYYRRRFPLIKLALSCSQSKIYDFALDVEARLALNWTSKAPKTMAHIPYIVGIKAMILGTSEVQVRANVGAVIPTATS